MPMPSPRTICEKPAPLATAPSMTACSKRSCRCFSAANSTGSGSPTRRSPSLKPLPLSEHKREDSVEATIDRIMQTYALLVHRSGEGGVYGAVGEVAVCRSTLGCHTRESGYRVHRGRSILIANALEYWA